MTKCPWRILDLKFIGLVTPSTRVTNRPLYINHTNRYTNAFTATPFVRCAAATLLL